MNGKNNIQPPGWAQRFLQWYCRPELAEDLEGDLFEYFQRNVKDKGVRRARFIYVLDVLKFFRPYTLRKPEFLNTLIHWIMLGSYIKTSMRSIMRNRLFSTINIAGLAISLSVGLMMIAVLVDLFSYDKFHENHERIYRVNSQYQYLNNWDENVMATTSLKAATLIKESFSGIDDLVILHRGFDGDFTYETRTVPASGFYASDSFFKVFSFELVKGNPQTALKSAFSVVITESAAKKIFGDAEPLGKTISLEKKRDYTVTGVVKDLPRFSHIKFEILGSLASLDAIEAETKTERKWDAIWRSWVYVLMKDGTDLTLFQENLDKLSVREDKTVKNTHIALSLQPMDKIMMADDLSNEIGPVMGKLTVWIFSALAFVVILSACFNYTNLSIARSFRRSKEVGIRKTIGALRGHVMSQFIVESIIIALLSLVLAFILFVLFRPHFIGLEPSLQELLTLTLSPQLIVCFIVFAILVGAAAGFFPALFFAKINAIQVLKNLSAIPSLKRVTVRKVLIVFQYTISIIFITATVIMHKQYNHFLAFDLGFSTENILNIKLQGIKPELLKKELSELPEVKAISQSRMITSVGETWGTGMKNPNDPQDSANVYYNMVDEHYLPLHGHQLLAGGNFNSHSQGAVEDEVIVNLETLKRFNISPKDPAKAIDQVVKVDGKEMRIVGVLKDFSYGRANSNMNKEVIFRYNVDHDGFVNIKVLSSDWPATYAKIESIWKKLDSVHPLEAKFYDEQLEEAYRGLSASVKLSGFLATLVICIASIGLLGMVVFTTETRLREISIRKVMGASESGLIYLLGKSFIVLLAIAAGIALPVTFLVFDQLLLPEMTNHAPISVIQMLVGVLAVLFIAGLMIGSQTLKVARTNPADVLKVE